MIVFVFLQLVFAQEEESVFKENDFRIEGQKQKPEVFLTLQKGDTSNAYELELRESFIPKILESMKKEPL